MRTERKKRPSDASRLDALESRLDAIEARLVGDDATARERRRTAIGVDVDLLERLAARDADGEIGGAILYAGAVRVGTRRYAWHREHAARDLIEGIDPEALAPALFALANPVRLRIVLTLARGARTGAEITETADAGSTGQLYHHLGELLRAGVLAQPRRGVYEIATPALVPVLAMAAAALDLRAP
ncbi:helix-turn-helix domain-containing protein [Sandaracinus amylolyticus]|uniref:helix-turn-helix domain-containing protein n=1 Tax=Sandaracinus amylolyticus TaxID=927083 RepID=UPI001F276A90|nr:helix-turn-helix domain-containing protein [Sandaracinus amylolyticus]UJR79658.1 Transcriptional regulator [Sandaracinus amylolyticus]